MSNIINLKTGKKFDLNSSQERLQAMIDAGVAPSICLETASKSYSNLAKKLKRNQALFSIGNGTLAGSANASVGRGMMRNVGARNAAMFRGVKLPPGFKEVSCIKSIYKTKNYIDTLTDK